MHVLNRDIPGGENSDAGVRAVPAERTFVIPNTADRRHLPGAHIGELNHALADFTGSHLAVPVAMFVGGGVVIRPPRLRIKHNALAHRIFPYSPNPCLNIINGSL